MLIWTYPSSVMELVYKKLKVTQRAGHWTSRVCQGSVSDPDKVMADVSASVSASQAS